MKKFTKVCALVALAATALGASAANWHGMKIMLKDGSDVHVQLTDAFNATFTPSALHLENEYTTIDVPRSQISSMNFTQDAPVQTSVDEIGAETEPVLANGKMSFHALPADSRIAVYNAAGIEMSAAVASGDYELDLSSLPKGNYIVSVNRVSYKVYLK